MDPYRGTCRTTQTLIEAYEHRESATEQLPILVYAASFQDAERLVKMFCDLALSQGSTVVRTRKLQVVLDGEQHFEFRGFSDEENSPAGKDYSLIFIDHYAWETVQGGPNGLRPGESFQHEGDPPSPLVRLWNALKEKLG
jgi:hypothetical protein